MGRTKRIYNKQNVWGKKYDFSLMKKINRIRKPNRNRGYYVKNVRTILQNDCHPENTNLPFKVHLKKKLEIHLPSVVDVNIHQQEKLQYQGNHLFVKLKLEEVIKFQGDQKISIPQMPLQKQKTAVPDIVLKYFKQILKINLWLYKGKRLTDWHYDGHDNFLCMLQGSKIVYLAAPENLYSRGVFSLFNNHYDPSITKKSLKQKNHSFKIYRAVISPKQSLFIPRGWWHKVFSAGQPSIAVNYWGNSLAQILKLSKSDKNILLRELLCSASQQKCAQNIQNWENLPQNSKQQLRSKVGQHLIKFGFNS